MPIPYKQFSELKVTEYRSRDGNSEWEIEERRLKAQHEMSKSPTSTSFTLSKKKKKKKERPWGRTPRELTTACLPGRSPPIKGGGANKEGKSVYALSKGKYRTPTYYALMPQYQVCPLLSLIMR